MAGVKGRTERPEAVRIANDSRADKCLSPFGLASGPNSPARLPAPLSSARSPRGKFYNEPRLALSLSSKRICVRVFGPRVRRGGSPAPLNTSRSRSLLSVSRRCPPGRTGSPRAAASILKELGEFHLHRDKLNKVQLTALRGSKELSVLLGGPRLKAGP
jgi:hypothetical protein